MDYVKKMFEELLIEIDAMTPEEFAKLSQRAQTIQKVKVVYPETYKVVYSHPQHLSSVASN